MLKEACRLKQRRVKSPSPANFSYDHVYNFQIYYWRESSLNEEPHRRDGPNYNDSFTNVTGGESHQTTVYGLEPGTKYHLVIKAFSCGGEGPASHDVSFYTTRAGMSVSL